MKTISASSPHCSIFRCQASGACDLLLKNKYVRKRRLPSFYQQFIKCLLLVMENQSVSGAFIFKRDRSQTGMAYMMYGLCHTKWSPYSFENGKQASVRAANFIISIGEQLDRRPRKWHLLWVIEFSCCSLLGGSCVKKQNANLSEEAKQVSQDSDGELISVGGQYRSPNWP